MLIDLKGCDNRLESCMLDAAILLKWDESEHRQFWNGGVGVVLHPGHCA